MGKFFCKNKRTIVSLLLGVVLVVCSFSQVWSDISEADLFERAYRAYLSYRPESSLEQFNTFLKEYPSSSARDAALFWKAKSLMQLKRKEEAYRILFGLEKEFPESIFRIFAREEIELIDTELAQTERAITAFSETAAVEKISSADIKIYEQKITELQERNNRLEKEISDILQKNQIAEKGLARALDERNNFELAVNAERMKNAELIRRSEGDASRETASAKFIEEKNVLEKKLANSDLLIKSYEDEIEKNRRSVVMFKKEKEDAFARIKELESSLLQMEATQELRKTAAEKISALEKEKESFIDQLKGPESVKKDLAGEKSELKILLEEETKKVAELSQALNQRLSGDLEEAKWAEERKALHIRLKEFNEKIYSVDEEKESLKKTLVEIEKEKEKALNRVKELELVRAQQEIILADIREKQKDWQEMAQYVKELMSKNQALESSLKAEREKTEDFSSTESDKENLRLMLQDLQSAHSEMDRLKHRYKDQLNAKDKEIHTLQSSLSKELKTSEALSKDNAELSSLRKEYDNISNEYASLLKKSEKERSEISSLRDRINQYEKPLISIGNKKFSLSHIIDENMLSTQVLEKMNVESAPWKTGNAYEDFIVEEVLLWKAQKKGIKPRQHELRELADTHQMNKSEREYLAKYLIVSHFVNSKLGRSAISNHEIRKYYEDHRANYIRSIGEKRVKILSLPYTGEDEIEKALAVVELHNSAKKGGSFEYLYNSNSRMISFKEMNFNELPAWIQSKTRNLKSGEISDVISSENNFMLILIEAPNIAYRDFDDVKKEIRRILISRVVVDSQNFFDWLGSLRKEALDIR